MPPRLVPRAGPAVWTGDTMRPSHWMLPVGADAAGELLAVAASLGGARPARPADAPLPRLGPVLREAADRLENGAGFALLRGLPADRFTADAAGAALMTVAAHLGALVPQDGDGEAFVAPPRRSAARPLVAEPADAVAMFCRRTLPEGEALLLHSAAALHNELMRRNRGAVAALHAPLPHRRRNSSSAEPVMLPVFCNTGGAFVGRYDRAALLEPLLDPTQAAAVAALDAVAAEPGRALAIPLRAGDLLLVNPYLVWRSEPPAAAEAAGEPRMLGVWLSTRAPRAAAPAGFRPGLDEAAAPGARRGDGGPAVPGGPGMVGG